MTSRATLAAIWLLPTIACVTLVIAVYSRHRIVVPASLDEPARAAIIATLRAAIASGTSDHPGGDHDDTAFELPTSEAHAMNQVAGAQAELADRGPIVVRLWHEGRELARVQASGRTVADAVQEAARALASDSDIPALTPEQRRLARLQVDIVVGRAALTESSDLARALGLHPGLEGLGVRLEAADPAGSEILLLPDELSALDLHGTAQPLRFIPDFTIGLDVTRADRLMADRSSLGVMRYQATARQHFRFRTDTFVERPASDRHSGGPLPLVRGSPPGPEVTAGSLRDAALAGGRYLVAHLADNGRYIYQRNLRTGRGSDPTRPGPYSIPRHAGTTYYLAELYRLTGEEWLREPIERAFAHLEELIHAGGCSGRLPGGDVFACVVDRGKRRTSLGSTALTVVALVEYQRATGDQRHAELAARLSEWLLWMQRPDGSFAHLFDVRDHRKDEETQKLYYAGEAALALARMHAVTGEERYRDAAERALDDLVGWYDFFLGGFFYGEEHWTCIAAEAAYPAVEKSRYVEFCHGYAEFLRAQQPLAGEFPDQPDYVGTYNATPFLVPQNTPAGSRTEAVISAYELGAHHGRADPRILDQIQLTMGYVLRQQIRPESDFAVSPLATGIGAVPATPVDRSVRIDYVQHVGSAMIRAAGHLARSQDPAGSGR